MFEVGKKYKHDCDSHVVRECLFVGKNYSFFRTNKGVEYTLQNDSYRNHTEIKEPKKGPKRYIHVYQDFENQRIWYYIFNDKHTQEKFPYTKLLDVVEFEWVEKD